MSEGYKAGYGMGKHVAEQMSKEDILFDPNRPKMEKRALEGVMVNNCLVNFNNNKNRLKSAEIEEAMFKSVTKDIKYCDEYIQSLDNGDYKVYGAAISEFCKIINNKIPQSEVTSIKTGKKAKVNLSGKSLFGNVKRKVKNFLYPNNAQKRVEEALSTMKENMVKNPGFRKFVMSFRDGEDISREDFMNSISSYETKLSKDVSDSRSAIYNSEHTNGYYQAKLDHIQKVKNKAARDIEIKKQARENIGITDAQANTGIDKLAERAKAMDGMSAEERMKFRREQLRGTKNPENKPVKKTITPNIKPKGKQL